MAKEKQEIESEIINETDKTSAVPLENKEKELVVEPIKKLSLSNLINEFVGYYWLFFAVLIGGSIGTYLGIKTFHPKIVRRLTAILVIYVSLRILLGF